MVLVSAPVRKSPLLRFCTAGHRRPLPPKLPETQLYFHRRVAGPSAAPAMRRPHHRRQRHVWNQSDSPPGALGVSRRPRPLVSSWPARTAVHPPPPSPSSRSRPAASSDASQNRSVSWSQTPRNSDFVPVRKTGISSLAKVERHLELSTVGSSGSLDTAQSTQRLHNSSGPLGHLVLA